MELRVTFTDPVALAQDDPMTMTHGIESRDASYSDGLRLGATSYWPVDVEADVLYVALRSGL